MGIHASRWRPLLALVVITSTVAGCGSLAGRQPASYDRAADITMRKVLPAQAEALPEVASATRNLGLTMLAAAPADANSVVSPSSLTMALAMLTEGARGRTLEELEATLGASGEARRDAFAALRGSFATMDGDPAIVQRAELPEQPLVHLADQVVVDDGYQIEPGYLEALADGFGVGVRRTDLSSSSAKQVLSEWVREHTGGLVKESAIEPGPDLRVVLQDAVLLAARWETPFLKANTSDQPFNLADGSRVTTETMSAARAVAFAETDGWTAIRLPYRDGRLYADLVLPPAGVDPGAVPAATLTKLTKTLDAAEPVNVDLTLPTLDLKPEPLNLLPTLTGLAPSALCGADDTDFSGMGPEALCVQQAVQQAVLTLDEDGTKAAAVTEVAMAASGMAEPARQFHLDRPFLLQIGDQSTSWPLFLAAVRDPRH